MPNVKTKQTQIGTVIVGSTEYDVLQIGVTYYLIYPQGHANEDRTFDRVKGLRPFQSRYPQFRAMAG